MKKTLAESIRETMDALNENESDIKNGVYKGIKVIISNGFQSRGYNEPNIIAITPMSPPMKSLKACMRDLESAGADGYVNTKQAGTPTIFLTKDDNVGEAVKKILGTDVSQYV